MILKNTWFVLEDTLEGLFNIWYLLNLDKISIVILQLRILKHIHLRSMLLKIWKILDIVMNIA